MLHFYSTKPEFRFCTMFMGTILDQAFKGLTYLGYWSGEQNNENAYYEHIKSLRQKSAKL